MNKKFLITLTGIFFFFNLNAQHTFSIVAVDTLTGEIGSAGATCLTTNDCGGCGGAIIISGVVPGKGAINAQATVCIPNVNRNNGMTQIRNGANAQSTLEFLLNGDACGFGTTANRQYGIVTMDDQFKATATGYTGNGALDYANHNTASSYSIQGNILIGQEVLDSMEQRFLREQGSLAEKLMAAMQGANIRGADSRCFSLGISSRSAFLRVAKPDDSENNLFLDLNVPLTTANAEPIDSLQSLFDNWILTSNFPKVQAEDGIKVFPNPSSGDVLFELSPKWKNRDLKCSLFDLQGRLLQDFTINQLNTQFQPELISGIYIYKITDEDGHFVKSGRISFIRS